MAASIIDMSAAISDTAANTAHMGTGDKAKPVSFELPKANPAMERRKEKAVEKAMEEVKEEQKERQRSQWIRRVNSRCNHPKFREECREAGIRPLDGKATWESAKVANELLDDFDKRAGKEIAFHAMFSGLNRLMEWGHTTYMGDLSMVGFGEFAEANVDALEPNFTKCALELPDWMVGGPFIQLGFAYMQMMSAYKSGDHGTVQSEQPPQKPFPSSSSSSSSSSSFGHPNEQDLNLRESNSSLNNSSSFNLDSEFQQTWQQQFPPQPASPNRKSNLKKNAR
jgi:hypothetical protein